MNKEAAYDYMVAKGIIKVKPQCETCKFRKYGMTTICFKYQWISHSVQKGGPCSMYEEDTNL